MKLSSWVTTNATPRVGSYRCHSSSHRILKKNFIVVIFGVWIFWLLHRPPLPLPCSPSLALLLVAADAAIAIVKSTAATPTSHRLIPPHEP